MIKHKHFPPKSSKLLLKATVFTYFLSINYCRPDARLNRPKAPHLLFGCFHFENSFTEKYHLKIFIFYCFIRICWSCEFLFVFFLFLLQKVMPVKQLFTHWTPVKAEELSGMSYFTCTLLSNSITTSILFCTSKIVDLVRPSLITQHTGPGKLPLYSQKCRH